MAYNRTKGIGPRGLGVSPLKQLKRSKDTIYVSKKYKPGDYVEEYELEDSIRSQTKDFPQLSVQDYSTVKKKKGKNYVVKDTTPLKELRKANSVKRNSAKVSPRKPPLKVGRADGTGLKRYNDKGILE